MGYVWFETLLALSARPLRDDLMGRNEGYLGPDLSELKGFGRKKGRKWQNYFAAEFQAVLPLKGESQGLLPEYDAEFS